MHLILRWADPMYILLYFNDLPEDETGKLHVNTSRRYLMVNIGAAHSRLHEAVKEIQAMKRLTEKITCIFN